MPMEAESAKMATLQVKNFDDKLYRALRRRAKRNHRSVSQEATRVIREGLDRPEAGEATGFRRLLDFAGTWKDSRSAEEIIAEIRKSRRNSRRFAGNRRVPD